MAQSGELKYLCTVIENKIPCSVTFSYSQLPSVTHFIKNEIMWKLADSDFKNLNCKSGNSVTKVTLFLLYFYLCEIEENIELLSYLSYRGKYNRVW